MPWPQNPAQNPWRPSTQQNPQAPGQPRSYGAPLGPQQAAPGAQRPRPQAANPQQIHAALDQREQAIKQELKKIQAVRTLMPQQGQQPTQRPGRASVQGSSQNAPSQRGSIPGVEAALGKAGAF